MGNCNNVWIDKGGKSHNISDIEDGYLLNIMKFINKGGGYIEHMSEDLIINLFDEATVRNLKHDTRLKSMLKSYRDRLDKIQRYEDAFDIDYWDMQDM